jgi:hypothetical protein
MIALLSWVKTDPAAKTHGTCSNQIFPMPDPVQLSRTLDVFSAAQSAPTDNPIRPQQIRVAFLPRFRHDCFYHQPENF